MRRRAEPTDAATPFRVLNTTPLIDVMLCLLVMMILFYPIQTHSLTLRQDNGFVYCPGILEYNKITANSDGSLLWNGQPASEAEIRFYLAQSRLRIPAPELQFEPDANTSYAVVDSVLATIQRSGVEAVGIVGNERYVRAF